MTDAPAALDVRDLRYAYAAIDGTPFALHVPALTLAPGEQVLLTGDSGSGKSTLLALIAGLLDAQSGQVNVAGQDVQALRGASRDTFRGRRIGMIFQTHHLLAQMTATQNVELALMFSDLPPAQHTDRARALLQRLGIQAQDRPAERLSLGQQQRVAIARAVACQPKLVLADEPTSALDDHSSAASMDLIQSVCRETGCALLCASHDGRLSERFARRVRMVDISKNT